MPERTDRAYLGDSVHAEWDGERIWLVTKLVTGAVHEIAITEGTFARLELYRMGLKRKLRAKRNKADASEA